METRTRDRKAQEPVAPRDRRLPLSEVHFITPQAVPGSPHRVRWLTAGVKISQTDVDCPPLFFDPEHQLVMVGDHCIPLAGGTVDYFKRARAAK